MIKNPFGHSLLEVLDPKTGNLLAQISYGADGAIERKATETTWEKTTLEHTKKMTFDLDKFRTWALLEGYSNNIEDFQNLSRRKSNLTKNANEKRKILSQLDSLETLKQTQIKSPPKNVSIFEDNSGFNFSSTTEEPKAKELNDIETDNLLERVRKTPGFENTKSLEDLINNRLDPGGIQDPNITSGEREGLSRYQQENREYKEKAKKYNAYIEENRAVLNEVFGEGKINNAEDLTNIFDTDTIQTRKSEIAAERKQITDEIEKIKEIENIEINHDKGTLYHKKRKYNLFTDNCSHATRRSLKKIAELSGEIDPPPDGKIKVKGISTPGDAMKAASKIGFQKIGYRPSKMSKVTDKITGKTKTLNEKAGKQVATGNIDIKTLLKSVLSLSDSSPLVSCILEFKDQQENLLKIMSGLDASLMYTTLYSDIGENIDSKTLGEIAE